jgi:hypothetical protein
MKKYLKAKEGIMEIQINIKTHAKKKIFQKNHSK